MSNVMLLFMDRAEGSATLSGGSYETDLPLPNLIDADFDLSKVARTTDLLLASTQFEITLDAAYYSRAFVVGPANFSPTYQYRIRSWTDSEFSVAGSVDTGWLMPSQGQGDAAINWGEPGFWMHDAAGKTHLIHVFDDIVQARYWTVEIDDQDNDDGYLDMGRLFMPMGWQPTLNYGYEGNGLGFRDNSLSAKNLAGGKQFWRRTNPRFFQFNLPLLPEDEGFTQAYRFMETVGFDKPVFVIPDPEDELHMAKRSFFGRVSRMDPLTQAVFERVGAGFEIEEII